MAIANASVMLANQTLPKIFSKNTSAMSAVGMFVDHWAQSGFPSAGSHSTTLAGASLSGATTVGAFSRVNPPSGNSAYISYLSANRLDRMNPIIIADRLWHNGGFTIGSTTAQTVNSGSFPARDINGTANGDGVWIGLLTSVAATSASSPTITVSYTNSDGVSGRIGTNIVTIATSTSVGYLYPIGLQAGDTGVRSIETVTFSVAFTAGTINMVAFRPITILPINSINRQYSADGLSLGLPKIHNDSVLFLMEFGNSTSSLSFNGMYKETWG